MTDIIVYTRPEVLEHKLELVDCFWTLHNEPRRELVPFESDIYFATNGYIRGGFIITDVQGEEIFFEAWRALAEPIPQKPFQGFKYFNV